MHFAYTQLQFSTDLSDVHLRRALSYSPNNKLKKILHFHIPKRVFQMKEEEEKKEESPKSADGKSRDEDGDDILPEPGKYMYVWRRNACI